MDETTRGRIRHIFLSPRSSFAFVTAASLLGIDFGEFLRMIKDGSIVAVSTSLGRRIAREEMIAEAVQVWGLAALEEALGAEAAEVLPAEPGKIADAPRLLPLPPVLADSYPRQEPGIAVSGRRRSNPRPPA